MPSFFYVLKPYRVFSLFHLVAVDVWFVASTARERVQKRLEITTRNILRPDVRKPSYAGLPNTAKILGRYIEKITLAFPTEVHFQNHAKLEKRKCEQAFFVLSLSTSQHLLLIQPHLFVTRLLENGN